MSIREIFTYPDERLRRVARKVDVIGEETSLLINDMQSTMYADQGIGLAATQIGEEKRIIVLDLSAGREAGNFLAFINPEITRLEGEAEDEEEGCLSVPGVRENVKRKPRLKLRAFDRDGREISLEADGLLARALQHEIDHLDGKLFIDRLPFLKGLMVRIKLRRQSAS